MTSEPLLINRLTDSYGRIPDFLNEKKISEVFYKPDFRVADTAYHAGQMAIIKKYSTS